MRKKSHIRRAMSSFGSLSSRGEEPLLRSEQGFTLIELLATIIILGIAFSLLASFIVQNSQAIALTARKEEAIFVREDVKEWLLYKAQIQDLANLNSFVFVDSTHSFNEEQQARRAHLILDNSGIQRSGEQTKFGEQAMPVGFSTERGQIIRKVVYDLENEEALPESLNTGYNRFYIGTYLDSFGEETAYLVEVLVNKKQGIVNYDSRTDGVGLTILIYDKESGDLLTETFINWVIES